MRRATLNSMQTYSEDLFQFLPRDLWPAFGPVLLELRATARYWRDWAAPRLTLDPRSRRADTLWRVVASCAWTTFRQLAPHRSDLPEVIAALGQAQQYDLLCDLWHDGLIGAESLSLSLTINLAEKSPVFLATLLADPQYVFPAKVIHALLSTSAASALLTCPRLDLRRYHSRVVFGGVGEHPLSSEVICRLIVADRIDVSIGQNGLFSLALQRRDVRLYTLLLERMDLTAFDRRALAVLLSQVRRGHEWQQFLDLFLTRAPYSFEFFLLCLQERQFEWALYTRNAVETDDWDLERWDAKLEECQRSLFDSTRYKYDNVSVWAQLQPPIDDDLDDLPSPDSGDSV